MVFIKNLPSHTSANVASLCKQHLFSRRYRLADSVRTVRSRGEVRAPRHRTPQRASATSLLAPSDVSDVLQAITVDESSDRAYDLDAERWTAGRPRDTGVSGRDTSVTRAAADVIQANCSRMLGSLGMIDWSAYARQDIVRADTLLVPCQKQHGYWTAHTLVQAERPGSWTCRGKVRSTTNQAPK